MTPCEQIAAQYNFPVDCCWSCHDDANEYGYNMLEVDGLEVCCRIANKAKLIREGENTDATT